MALSRLELKRNIVHLLVGLALALLIYYIDRNLAIVLFGAAIIIGLIVSEAKQRRVRLPVIDWFLRHMERENVKPGGGVLTFFTGCLIALIMFPSSIVFVSVIILAVGDSFSTIVGKAAGRTRIFKKKTLEGFLGGFVTSVIACLALAPAEGVIIACFVASIVELFAVIDDNIAIPPAASLILYLSKTL